MFAHRSAFVRIPETHGGQPNVPGSLEAEAPESLAQQGFFATGATGLEPATSGVTGRRSNQLSYAPQASETQYGTQIER
jgi:hypothetical protein